MWRANDRIVSRYAQQPHENVSRQSRTLRALLIGGVDFQNLS
jgi:hypothetical protein